MTWRWISNTMTQRAPWGRRPWRALGLCVGLMGLAACVGLGSMGDAGVHGLANDEAEVFIVGHDFEAVVAAAEKELESRGEVISALRKLGVIRGTVRDSDVTIRVESPQRGTTRVVVRARGDLGLSPRRSLAAAMARGLERRLP